MKIEEKTEIGKDLRIPTHEAKKALGLLWSSVKDDQLEFCDILLFVILAVSVVGTIRSFF